MDSTLCTPDSHLAAFANRIASLLPHWEDFIVRDWAEYLGVMLGPGGTSLMWQNPCRKCVDTVKRWKQIGAGLFLKTLASNIYIFPLFSYVGQVAKPDKHMEDALAFMRTSLFAGLGQWLPPGFLSSLKAFGFPTQLNDLGVSIFASKVRLALSSGIDVDFEATELRLHINAFLKNNPSTHPHTQWHSQAILKNVWLAVNEFRELGGFDAPEIRDCYRNLVGDTKGIQKKIHAFISGAYGGNLSGLCHKIRTRLQRWTISEVHPGHLEGRIRNRLKYLQGQVKPVAWIVYFKTITMLGPPPGA